MPFQCNDWVCNFKGKCSLSNNQTNDAVNVLCNCAQGYTGKNCLYTNKDYNYLFNWTLSIGAWLDQITKNGNYRVNDEDTFFYIGTQQSTSFLFDHKKVFYKNLNNFLTKAIKPFLRQFS